MCKKYFYRSIAGLVITAVGIGVLAAFMLPLWFLVVGLAALLVCLGLCYLNKY